MAIYPDRTRHSHTGIKGTQSKYCTSATGCLDKEPRNPMNTRRHEQLLLYFINIAVCNNLSFKPVIFQQFLYKHFIVHTQHFIECICDLNGD